MSVISIIDYGVCNLGSIRNMLRKLGFQSELVAAAAGLAEARKIILPGIGAFDHGVAALRERGLIEPLRGKALEEKVPLLGICLGMQLLGHGSEEGSSPGLGVIDGKCVKFRVDESGLRVPHMGWNEISSKRSDPILEGLGPGSRFYFTHSYYLKCDSSSDVLASTHYGLDFASAIQRGNVRGVQFHPEKSHRYGMALLRNFASI